MRAPHEAEHSLLARCQPTTWSAVQAVSITQARPSQMPSTWTTWWTSSHAGATGHILQYLSAFRLNVRPPPGIDAWGVGEKSQPRNASRPFAAESILRVAVAPQDMHCQRFEPAAVVPWPFILPPHTGHDILTMREIEPRGGIFRRRPAESRGIGVHVLSACGVGRRQLGEGDRRSCSG